MGVIAIPWHCYHRGGFHNSIIAFARTYFSFLSYSLRCNNLTRVFYTPGIFNVPGKLDIPSDPGSSLSKGKEVVLGLLRGFADSFGFLFHYIPL